MSPITAGALKHHVVIKVEIELFHKVSSGNSHHWIKPLWASLRVGIEADRFTQDQVRTFSWMIRHCFEQAARWAGVMLVIPDKSPWVFDWDC